MTIDRALRLLRGEGTVDLESSHRLVDKVVEFSRKESKKNPAYSFRKDPTPVPIPLPRIMRTSPLEVLRQVGVATAFDGNSPFAAVSRHWAQLRYCATMETKSGRLAVSALGNDVVYHHKVAQSEYLGIGFALVVAREILRRQYPNWEFHPVDAEYALTRGIPEAGSANQLNGTQSRPDYFLIGRPNSGRGGLKIVVLECKGTHSEGEQQAVRQLAKACTQVRSVEIEGHDLSSLMCVSRLLRSGIKILVIDPPGDADLWSGTPGELNALLDGTIEEPPEFFSVRPPAVSEPEEPDSQTASAGEASEDTESPEEELRTPHVVTVPRASRNWFAQVLARTFASSVLAFAGDDKAAADYRLPRRYEGQSGQQGLPLDEPIEVERSASISMQDGFRARGTSYTMPLTGDRHLEVFRGIEEGIYADLGEQRLSSYFQTSRRFWDKWRHRSRRQASDNTTISVGRDGTVLAIRVRG
ncbi:hypothetical protein SAMN02982929_05799 [Saccharopolyspora kobensis]|uniref:Uncharacterized protein n=1 Tax=Saccharopolyspora kobensis TaxID=146035 RepID=A0A1H6E915_9PSEU|nr:hypothetical protein SAMN02982929_05799 [Saccharopolyspora kobensis]SFD44429.1 hypothetical protein SAMN05216506_104328 [Saccharopolyspora kobensis]